MKTAIFALAASVAVVSAQVTILSNGTYSCAKPNANYCATDSLGSPIIIRCDANGVGQPGNCGDNLAGEPPIGVGGALCYQSSPTAGDANCEKNCVVYGTTSSTLPTSLCRPSFTASSTASSTASTTSSTTSSITTTSANVTSSSTIVTVTKTTTAILSTGTGSGGFGGGNGTTGGGSGSGSGSGRGSGSGATNTPHGPSSTTGISSVPTAGAAINGISGAAVLGLVAAYLL